MSYAICNVICGCELDERLAEWFQETDNDPKLVGFTMLYSGNAPFQPGYCGVKLCGFDECNNIPVSSLKLTPTSEQIEEATQKLRKVRANLAEWLESDYKDEPSEEKARILSYVPETPTVLLVWSTS